MRLSVASAVALLAVATCGRQAIAEDAVANAQKCSEDALARYAGSSSEPAEKIADMAFEKCAEQWELAAEIAARNPEVSHRTAEAQENCIKKLGVAACAQPLPYNVYYMQAAKRMFRHQAAIEVRDIRAKAAEKPMR
jgi:predicted membrane-bound mannosyltransferase